MPRRQQTRQHCVPSERRQERALVTQLQSHLLLVTAAVAVATRSTMLITNSMFSCLCCLVLLAVCGVGDKNVCERDLYAALL